MQTEEEGRKTRFSYEEGQYVRYEWPPSTEEEVQEETDNNLAGPPARDLGHGE